MKSKIVFTYLILLLLVVSGCNRKTIKSIPTVDCVEIKIATKKLIEFEYKPDCKLKEEFVNSYFIIEDCKLFNQLMECSCDSKINFSEYALIVGAKQFGNGTSIHKETVSQKCNQITYTIVFDNRGMSMNAPIINYGVVIEKPKEGIKILMRETIWTPKEMN